MWIWKTQLHWNATVNIALCHISNGFETYLLPPSVECSMSTSYSTITLLQNVNDESYICIRAYPLYTQSTEAVIDAKLCRILAGQLSSDKLGGREVKTSALVSRRSWVRIPPESPVKVFHSESTEYTVLYTRRCRAKLNQLFITLQIHDQPSLWAVTAQVEHTTKCCTLACTGRWSTLLRRQIGTLDG